MIEEAYVSFEVAKLLAEKGFKEATLWYTYGDGMNNKYSQPRTPPEFSIESGRYPLPTQQMAMRYLREEKGLVIVIKFSSKEPFKFVPCFYFVISKYDDGSFIKQGFDRDTFEEAANESILYCLENLI